MNATFSELPRGTVFDLIEQDDVLVLELAGGLGSLGWHPQDEDLESAVLSALDRTPRPRMVVNLSGVTYGGSEFVAFLLGLRKRLQARGGRLALAAVQESVSDVLHTLSLDPLLPQYESLEAAVHALHV